MSGVPARPRAHLPFRPEVIGDPECPILHRWTFLGDRLARRLPVKLLLHHFLPNADDRDTHDHPRPFWTFVLWGGYDDFVPCEQCNGVGALSYWPSGPDGPERTGDCPWCGIDHGTPRGLVRGDRMRVGMLRFRHETYAHRTRVLPSGCWTLVVMGPYRRRWGFWREGKWWSFRDYADTFGFGMRCGDEDR